MKPFEIYFVPMTHHDLGYTETIDDLLESYCRYYDMILDFCDETADMPYECQYRYSVEEFWSLDHYLKTTTEKNVKRMKKYVRSGRIEISALYANVIDGICSAEEIYRQTYPSFSYAGKCGTKITTACLTDMPGMSEGTITSLVQAGLRYLFAGFPRYFRWANADGKIPDMKRSYWDEEKLFGKTGPHAFYWKTKNGGKILTWYQDGYGWFGNGEEALVSSETYEDVEKRLPGFIEELRNNGNGLEIMRYIFHGSDNEMPSKEICKIAERWNEEHDDVKIKVATNRMFFEALEKEIKEKRLKIVEISGEIPHTDYTVLSLSDSHATALNRHTHTQMTVAESLDAFAYENMREKPNALRTKIYNDMILYDEHCFGMGFPFGNNNGYNALIKRSYAYDAARKTDELLNLSAANLNAQAKDGTVMLFTFAGGKNAFEKDAEDGYLKTVFGDTGTAAVLVSESGRKIYAQKDEIKDALRPVRGLNDTYACKAPSGKACSYTFVTEGGDLSLEKYEKTSGESHEEVKAAEDYMENEYYKVVFDTEKCGIKCIYDKKNGRNLTKKGLKTGKIITRDISSGVEYESVNTSLTYSRKGPYCASVIMYGAVYGVPQVVTEVTLYAGIQRVDVSFRVTFDRSPFREVFTCFPFDLKPVKCEYQGTGRTLDLFRDVVPGANTNDIAALHFAKVSEGKKNGVLMFEEAPVVSFGSMHPTSVSQAHHNIDPAGFTEPFASAKDVRDGTVYAMISYNNCRTNFAGSQEGEAIFTFAVTSGCGLKGEAEKRAEAFAHRPVIIEGECAEKKIRLEENVLPICVKKAEDGSGMVLRLREIAGKSCKMNADAEGFEERDVVACDAAEKEKRKTTDKEIHFKPFETVTIKFKRR